MLGYGPLTIFIDPWVGIMFTVNGSHYRDLLTSSQSFRNSFKIKNTSTLTGKRKMFCKEKEKENCL